MSISGEDFKVNLTQSTINQQEDQLLVAKVFTVVFFFFLINFFCVHINRGCLTVSTLALIQQYLMCSMCTTHNQ